VSTLGPPSGISEGYLRITCRFPCPLSKRVYSHAHARVWHGHQRVHPTEVLSPNRSHGRCGGRRRCSAPTWVLAVHPGGRSSPPLQSAAGPPPAPALNLRRRSFEATAHPVPHQSKALLATGALPDSIAQTGGRARLAESIPPTHPCRRVTKTTARLRAARHASTDPGTPRSAVSHSICAGGNLGGDSLTGSRNQRSPPPDAGSSNASALVLQRS
jgi:hypothetical protein